MPFRLTNAPAMLERQMYTVLVIFIGTGVLVYLDDVLIYAASVDELFSPMRTLLERLRAACIKCKPSKCNFV